MTGRSVCLHTLERRPGVVTLHSISMWPQPAQTSER